MVREACLLCFHQIIKNVRFLVRSNLKLLSKPNAATCVYCWGCTPFFFIPWLVFIGPQGDCVYPFQELYLLYVLKQWKVQTQPLRIKDESILLQGHIQFPLLSWMNGCVQCVSKRWPFLHKKTMTYGSMCFDSIAEIVSFPANIAFYHTLEWNGLKLVRKSKSRWGGYFWCWYNFPFWFIIWWVITTPVRKCLDAVWNVNENRMQCISHKPTFYSP